jgi:lysophospholipase L1-like esterase
MTTSIKPREAELRNAVAPPTQPAHRPWWHVTLEAALLIAVGVAGLELVLNAAGVGVEEILQPDAEMGVKHIPNKPVVWRMEGYSNERFSSAGLRDVEHSVAKPAMTYRIALLGDSATEGLQVPMADTYSTVLQQLYSVAGKKTEVLNFGCSSYSTGQEVLQFEREVAQYKPDLTILLYNRGDALENVRKPGDFKCEPRPYFYIDSAGTLQQDNAVLQHNAKALAPNPVVDALRRHSRLYGVFSHANLTLSLNEPLYRKVRGWVTAPFNAGKKRTETASVPTYTEQDSWKVTAGLIERLNADCQKQGSKLLVVAFPNVVNDPEFARQIAAVEKLGKESGFEVFDLTPKFRWHPNPKSLFLKYHFSSAGHRFVAERIAEALPAQ